MKITDILRIPAQSHDSLSTQTDNAVAIRLSSPLKLECKIEVSDDDIHWRSLTDEISQLHPYYDLPQSVLSYRYFRLETEIMSIDRSVQIQRSYCNFCRAATNFRPANGVIHSEFAPRVKLFDVCAVNKTGYYPTNNQGIAIAVSSDLQKEVDFLFFGIVDLRTSNYVWTRIGYPVYLSKTPGEMTEKHTPNRQQLGIILAPQLILFSPQL